MPKEKETGRTIWRKERAGLIMIIASILAIGAVVFLVVNDRSESRLTQIRSQGVGLARVLGNMSWDEIVPAQGRQGILQTLKHSQGATGFAYGVVVDRAGVAAAEAGAPGVLVPNLPIASEPAAWLGEREILDDDGKLRFLEFHAPAFSNGELMGHIRLGYYPPSFQLDAAGLSKIAMLGLPVFLLTPLFYFLFRSEIRPLRKVSEDLDEMLKSGSMRTMELHPSGELGAFIERFTAIVNDAQHRINALQVERDTMLTDSKLLAYRQGKVEAILKMLPDAILVVDEAGTVSYVNQRVENLLGVNNLDVAGKKPREWCNQPQLAAFLGRRGAGKNQVGFISDSVVFSPEHDAEKLIEAKVYPLFSPRDEDTLFGEMVVLKDVSDEHLAKRSRSEFVAQMAHELKTPLNVLAMYSESLLGEDGNDESFRVEGLNTIHDEVERLSTFINSMLALSQFELGSMQLHRQRVRLPDLLHDAFMNVSQSGHGQNLTFDIQVPREMSAANIDKDLMRIALNNLLTNAIKYNRPGGSVKLTAEESESTIEIRVSDTGIGVAEADKEKVFDKFYRSDSDEVREKTGHGLGLPLAEQIVQMHHGSLILESEPGEGSTFTIRLNKDVAGFAMAGSA